jgi:hypothetical protein
MGVHPMYTSTFGITVTARRWENFGMFEHSSFVGTRVPRE